MLKFDVLVNGFSAKSSTHGGLLLLQGRVGPLGPPRRSPSTPTPPRRHHVPEGCREAHSISFADTTTLAFGNIVNFRCVPNEVSIRNARDAFGRDTEFLNVALYQRHVRWWSCIHQNYACLSGQEGSAGRSRVPAAVEHHRGPPAQGLCGVAS